METSSKPINILLIEDDEDDFIIVRNSLSQVENNRYQLLWIKSFDEAMKKGFPGELDVCLLDYRLGAKDGLSVLQKLKENHFNAPVIMLTGQGSRDLDIDAMQMGADDYIEKDQMNSYLLERSIRYSIERWKQLQQLRASEQKLRQLSAKILNAQEQERKLIAKELHDSIGSNLTAIKLMLESNQSALASCASEIDFPMDRILSAILETIKETQRITKNLRPETLDKLKIIPSLKSVARQFSEINKKINVDLDFNAEEQDIPESLKIILFRVVQEALTNIAKHSHAKKVNIRLGRDDTFLELAICNNGKGFGIQIPNESGSDRTRGMGLDTMRERVQLSDGQFEITSEKNKGTTIRAFWVMRP